jgi:predicted ATP-dependent endonuclease of OLD family
MRIELFRIMNCFGFRDSGEVNLVDERNLLYLLGRNSSGKTSFLTALRYLEYPLIPQDHANFRNFNASDEQGQLLAKFRVEKGDLDIHRFMKHFQSIIGDKHSSDTAVVGSTEYKEQLKKLTTLTERLYGELITSAEKTGTIWVRKSGSGDYQFSSDASFKVYSIRKQQLQQEIGRLFPGNHIIVAGTRRPVNILFDPIEKILFLLFPRIIFFGDAYFLFGDLPDQITEGDLATIKSSSDEDHALTKALVAFLGENRLRRFLTLNSARESRQLLEQMQVEIDKLVSVINKQQASVGATGLVGIDLTGQNLLQITVRADEKESFYRHLSQNTKLLIAYFLYQSAYKIEKDILLFDEIDSGFHATVQEMLLHFLLLLGKNGNIVIVSTHSEYLIDPDYLAGVRIMGKDSDMGFVVHNHYFKQLQGKGTGDFLALRPITDAIGLKYGSARLMIKDKIIIVEGITDLLYLRTFHRILGYSTELHVAPARGGDTMLPIIALLIGEGMRFKVILDEDKSPGNVRRKIQRDYSVDDPHIYEIPIPPVSAKKKGAGIEDIFSKTDFRLLLEAQGRQVSADFDTTSNSEYIKIPDNTKATEGPKRLVANEFYQHVGDYQEDSFDAETLNNARAVLDFCAEDVWFSI